MAEFELDFLVDRSDEGLLAEVRRVAQLVNKPVLTTSEFDKHGKVSVNTLRNRLGHWQTILQRANLGHLYSGRPVTQRMREMRARKLSDADIIDMIRKAAKDRESNCLLRREFESDTGISKNTINRRFGSWENAARLAGLKPHPRGFRRHSQQMCYENLLGVWRHYGRCPEPSEMNRPPSIIKWQTYKNQWGSWPKALAAFVEWANSEPRSI